MAIKFEKIQPGMTLFQRGRRKMGNTRMTCEAEWPVYIESVDPEKRRAMARWNNNASTLWFEHQLVKLYRNPKPKV